MKREVYDPIDKVRRLGKSASKHPFRFTICAIILFCISYIWTTAGEFYARSRDDMLMIACEMICETGPDFVDSASRHKKMVDDYIKYPPGSLFIRAVCSLPGVQDPRDVLAGALQTLENAGSDQRQAAQAVWLAGEQILQARVQLPKSQSRIAIFGGSRRVSKKLLDVTREALSESEDALKDYTQEPNFPRALALCEANRKSMVFVFVCRFALKGNSFLERFEPVVRQAKNEKKALASNYPENDPNRHLLMIMSNSEVRRLQILAALKSDMSEAYDLMWKAIDQGLRTRMTILEVNSRFAEGS